MNPPSSEPDTRRPPASPLWPGKRLLAVLVMAPILYIGSYVALSVQGVYAPHAIGPSTVKSYAWAPLGFIDRGKVARRQEFYTFYAPLVLMDWKFWHTHGEDARSGDPRFPRIDFSRPSR
jgi:hypothetical protein